MLKNLRRNQVIDVQIANSAPKPDVSARLTPAFLLFSTLLLLLFVATRLHGLLALPAFYDEVGHIIWAQQIFHGHPFEPLLGAKPLMPYVLSVFNPLTSTNGLFVGRLLVTLTGLLGIAAMLGLGRLLHSKLTAIIGGLLWLLCPYLFFFQRMVLADTVLATLATLAGWALVRLSMRLNKPGNANAEAALAGIILALCALAKFTGLVFAILPLLVLILLGRNRETTPLKYSWARRLRAIVIVYGVLGVALVIPAIVITTIHLKAVEAFNPVENIQLADVLLNTALASDSFARYFSIPFLIFLASTTFFAWRRGWRQRLLPLFMVAAPVSTLILTANVLYLRYLVIVVPGLLLLAALGLTDLTVFVATTQERFAIWRAGTFLAVIFGLWLALFVGPFIETAYSNPAALSLPFRDRGEYLQDWPSGYGVRDVVINFYHEALGNGQPLVAVGMVGNCLALPFFLPMDAPVTILCHSANTNIVAGMIETREIIRQQIAQHGSVLVITEIDGPYSMWPLPGDSQLLATYPRPGGSSATVELFRVTNVWPTF